MSRRGVFECPHVCYDYTYSVTFSDLFEPRDFRVLELAEKNYDVTLFKVLELESDHTL